MPEGLSMKNDKYNDNVLFDDNETLEDLIITDMTEEELEDEYNRIFKNIGGTDGTDGMDKH